MIVVYSGSSRGSSRYSRMSPGWQSRIRQMLSRVENLTALAFPVFNIERFDGVIFIFSASSPRDIFLLAIITSRLTTIAIFLE